MVGEKKNNEIEKNKPNIIETALNELKAIEIELKELQNNEIEKNKPNINETILNEFKDFKIEFKKLKDNEIEKNKPNIIKTKLKELKNIEIKLSKAKDIETDLKELKDIETKLKFHYIDNPEIKKYLKLKNSEIKYINIAHLYFHLSEEVYKILCGEKTYRWGIRSNHKLKEAYLEIFRVIGLINSKLPSNKKDRISSKPTIFQNKKLLFESLNHYGTVIASTENRRFYIYTIIISGIALLVSIVSIFHNVLIKIILAFSCV